MILNALNAEIVVTNKDFVRKMIDEIAGIDIIEEDAQ
jgi:hypothetical protein